MPHVADLNPDRFTHVMAIREASSVRRGGHAAQPGHRRGVDGAHILDVEAYPDNVKYVEGSTSSKRSDSDVTYVQHMNLPLIGGSRCRSTLSDYGMRDGFGSWHGIRTTRPHTLNKARGAYRVPTSASWLLADAVGYAPSTAPLKSDVGTPYMAMTKGADATASEVIKRGNSGHDRLGAPQHPDAAVHRRRATPTPAPGSGDALRAGGDGLPTA